MDTVHIKDTAPILIASPSLGGRTIKEVLVGHNTWAVANLLFSLNISLRPDEVALAWTSAKAYQE